MKGSTVHSTGDCTAAQLCVIATTVCLSVLILPARLFHGLFVLSFFLQPEAQWNPLTITFYAEREHLKD